MEFSGNFEVAASPPDAWSFLLDPESLGSCIPNCQNIETIDETHYIATIGITVSYVSVTFEANVEIQEQTEEEYVKVNITGNAEENDSQMDATGELWLEPTESGGTTIEYKNDIEVSGRLMNMGSRIVKRVGQRVTNETIENIQEKLGSVEVEVE